MPTITSPSRRVLGEKDANASIHRTSQRGTSKFSVQLSAPSSPRGSMPLALDRPRVSMPSPHAGRKRRISEVDGIDAGGARKGFTHSQMTDLMSDSASDEEGMREPTGMARTTHDRSSWTMPSPEATQDDQYTMDAHFDLPAEEMSQQTRDRIHAVPLPQNSSQPHTHDLRISLHVEESQTSSGLSSFVDFGGSDASQGNDKSSVADVEMDDGSSIPQVSEEELRKTMLHQKAAELRTRLQFAYFRVQTNQTTTPFSRLKIPESMQKADVEGSPQRAPHLHPPSTIRGFPRFAPPAQNQSQQTLVANLETRMSEMRAQATAQDKPVVRSLESLPVPRIQPTAYSARFHDAARVDHKSSAGSAESNPRSSELSQQPGNDQAMPDNAMAVLPTDVTTAGDLTQRGSGSPSSNRSISTSRCSLHSEVEEDKVIREAVALQSPVVNDHHLNESKAPPSSAVKGEAADSLLQLMRGVKSGKQMCGY